MENTGIITQEIINAATDYFNSIRTEMGLLSFLATMEKFLDNEDALREAQQYFIDSLLEIGTNSAIDKEIIEDIIKITVTALILGFITERIARDTLMDTQTITKDIKTIRDFETLEAYINRIEKE